MKDAVTKKDLRIGNYIRLRMYAYDEVDTHNEIIGLDQESPYVNTITFDYLDYDEIEPIPLSEEWLLAFGFVEYDRLKNDDDISYYEECIKNFIGEVEIGKYKDGFYSLWIGANYVEETSVYKNSNVLKHVHQLQNLFFSLTGKELTLKS